jgi:Leucine-rich repeat (LRR) protein
VLNIYEILIFKNELKHLKNELKNCQNLKIISVIENDILLLEQAINQVSQCLSVQNKNE